MPFLVLHYISAWFALLGIKFLTSATLSYDLYAGLQQRSDDEEREIRSKDTDVPLLD